MKEFKAGDTVFHTLEGKVVLGKNAGNSYPLSVPNQGTHSLDGKYLEGDKHPALFHSPQDAAEYFSKIPWKKTVVVETWTNIYPSGYNQSHATEKEADRVALDGRIACEHFRKEYEVDA